MTLRSLFRRQDDAAHTWRVTEKTGRHGAKVIEDADYYPLVDTLRLYAGWLLAWYFLIYATGSYQLTRLLPFHSDLIEYLFLSPVVLNFACLSFLFLLLSDVHRRLGKGVILGVILIIVGVVIFGVFEVNI